MVREEHREECKVITHGASTQLLMASEKLRLWA